MAYDPPYRPSRAALRDRYGTRSINASAPQSAMDSTPSGRIRYRMQQEGKSEAAATMADAREFRNNFMPRTPGFDPALLNPAASPWRGVTAVPGSFADTIQQFRQSGANSMVGVQSPYGTVGFADPVTISNPTPLSFNLSEPSPYGAADIAPYSSTAPAAYVPPWRKKPATGYMGSVLGEANKWLT